MREYLKDLSTTHVVLTGTIHSNFSLAFFLVFFPVYYCQFIALGKYALMY